mmetsp:Transcript_47617/g.58537  ORF Transcript_47617/g.58537 Transcript_47617/m.58537 type:complete len:288 (-) Transcript_47617:69-932(-)
MSGLFVLKEATKVIVGLNAVGFTITMMSKSHKITDLVGTGAFGAAAVYCLYKSKNKGPTAKMLTLSATLWSARLALFLFARVNKLGEDKRLRMFFPDESKGETWLSKGNPNGKGTLKYPPIVRLSIFWILQTLWGLIVLSPVYMGQYSSIQPIKIPKISLLGAGLFGIFLAMECYADFDKFFFKNNPNNSGKFIQRGLYKYSQMPNYFSEMCIWWSVYLMALPVLPPSQYITIISPLFTMLLLTKVSGAPFLENGWNKKYGNLPEFKEWRANTNKYIPWFPKKSKNN